MAKSVISPHYFPTPNATIVFVPLCIFLIGEDPLSFKLFLLLLGSCNLDFNLPQNLLLEVALPCANFPEHG